MLRQWDHVSLMMHLAQERLLMFPRPHLGTGTGNPRISLTGAQVLPLQRNKEIQLHPSHAAAPPASTHQDLWDRLKVYQYRLPAPLTFPTRPLQAHKPICTGGGLRTSTGIEPGTTTLNHSSWNSYPIMLAQENTTGTAEYIPMDAS